MSYFDENVPSPVMISDERLLLLEQQKVQADKHRDRLLPEYDSCIFPSDNINSVSTDASDFIANKLGGAASFEAVLLKLAAQSPDSTTSWVDMAGGRGFAMRQAAHRLGGMATVAMTNVDLFDWPLASNVSRYEQLCAEAGFELANELYSPEFIRADVQTVELSQQPDLITCMQAMQYLNNPLGAVASWYNHLRAGGLLIVGGHTSDSRFPGNAGKPYVDFFEQLERHKIPHAIGYPQSVPVERSDRFVIEKRPGTFLKLNTTVARVAMSDGGYKTVTYANNKPIVSVMYSDSDELKDA